MDCRGCGNYPSLLLVCRREVPPLAEVEVIKRYNDESMGDSSIGDESVD